MPTDSNDRKALLRSIRLSPIASIVTDARAADNPIIAANVHFERLSGYSEAELIGRNCRILAGRDTDPAQSAALGRAIASASPQVVELVNYRKDGNSFLNAVMVAPVLGEDGRPDYFFGSQMEVRREHAGLTGLQARERIATLTPRQQMVLRLMAQGLRNRQIAERMSLSEKTIKMHRGALVMRLGVSTAAQAIRLAVEAEY